MTQDYCIKCGYVCLGQDIHLTVCNVNNMILSVVCIVLQNKVVINLNQFWLMTFFKIQELLIPIACNISSMHTHFMEIDFSCKPLFK